MRIPLPAILLLAGCATSGPLPRTATRDAGAYTPTPQATTPIGGLSTSCRFETNGLGADCRRLDREPEGPITPIAAGQAR